MSPEMAEVQGQRGEAAEASPLSAVFPGETIDVPSIGRPVTVAPWGARALMHEVPVLLGRLMAHIAPIAEQMRGGAGDLEALPALTQGAAGELFDLVCWSAKLTPAEQERLSAADFARLARAVVRQNKDFFAELAALYADVTREDLGVSGP
jgi:hypothetical protein